MNLQTRVIAILGTAGALVLDPAVAFACPVCYGAIDAPIATAMNLGIFVLLGFVGLVLGGVAAFMLNMARRAHALRTTSEKWQGGVAGSEV